MIALQRAFLAPLLLPTAASSPAARGRACSIRSKRCSALCTGRVDKEGYAKLVEDARSFLKGRTQDVQARLAASMTEEGRGARLRRRGTDPRPDPRPDLQVQGRQDINVQGLGDADVIAAQPQAGPHACVQVFFFRGGQNWGNRAYFPAHTQGTTLADMIGAFIGQFYANRAAPPCVLINEMPSEAELIAEALSTRH